MYTPLLSDVRFHRMLQQLDEKTAAAVKAQGCTRGGCDGVLHWARYRRKPRGLPMVASGGEYWRLSFCCAKECCRGRTTPPSLIYLGRRTYLAVAVTVITVMRCGLTPVRLARLRELAGVSRQTVLRWEQWWQQLLPQTVFWRSACGAFPSSVETGALPASLFEQFTGDAAQQLLALLRFLAPLTGGKRGGKAL